MSQGQHRPGYKRPRTGERRRTRQHCRIDALPAEVRARIQELRGEGKTWEQISQASREFAGLHLPTSSLHRWHDLRVEQPACSPNFRDIEKLASFIADRVFDRIKPLFPDVCEAIQETGRRPDGHRRTGKNFYINTLPAQVREEIERRHGEGQTWEQIAEASRTFSSKRLSAETLQRWFEGRSA